MVVAHGGVVLHRVRRISLSRRAGLASSTGGRVSIGATSNGALCHLRPRRSRRQSTTRRSRRRCLGLSHLGPRGAIDHSEAVTVSLRERIGIGGRRASLSSTRRWPRLDRRGSRDRCVERSTSGPQQRAGAVGPPWPKIRVMTGGGGGALVDVARLVARWAASWTRSAALKAGHRTRPAWRGVARWACPVTWTELAPAAAAASSRGPWATSRRAALCRIGRCGRTAQCAALRASAAAPILASELSELPLHVGNTSFMVRAASVGHRHRLC